MGQAREEALQRIAAVIPAGSPTAAALVRASAEIKASGSVQPPTRAQRAFEGLVDTVLGAIGIGPETPANLAGQLLSAGLPLAGGVKRGIRAFHGSPHDFDRFSMEKIGTGEGAQVYGHGLYFAENEAVANEYRKSLSDYAIEVGGRIIGGKPVKSYDEAIEDQALSWVQDAYDKGSADAFETAAIWASRALNPERAQPVIRQIREWQQQGAKVRPQKGHGYEVTINADPDEFLDWDQPLSQQPPKVQEALRAAGLPSYPVKTQTGAQYDPPGQVAYQALAKSDVTNPVLQQYTPGPSTAAQRLREAGVKGIKYLDQGSRRNVQLLTPSETVHGQWLVKELPNGQVLYRGPDEALARQAYGRMQSEQTRNFVVFDDALIDILRKYGLLPAAVLGGGALADQR